MIIRPLSSGEYLAGREQYRELVERALQYSHRRVDNLEMVEAAITTHDAHPVVIEHDDQLVALAVVELLETKEGRYWNVWTLAGERMSEWAGDFLEWMEGVAARNGASHTQGVMLGGRPGWARELKQYGYETQAVILKKRVETCH